MSPSNPQATAQLRRLIYYNLDNDFLQNALFLAGRLHGLDAKSADTIHLVALCHLKLGHFRAAYDYSKDTRLRSSTSSSSGSASATLGCAYVFAQACLALGRYSEGISALERCRGVWISKNHWNKHSETERRPGPDAPAVCNLLGKLCRANGEEKKAAEYFADSLKGNPFLWDAFIDLSDAGVPLRTANVFIFTDDMRRDLAASAGTATPSEAPQQPIPPQALANKSTNDPNTPAAIYDPFNTTRSAVDPGLNYGGPNFMSRLNGNVPGISLSQPLEWDTPRLDSKMDSKDMHYDEDVMMDDNLVPVESDAPAAPMRKKGGLGNFVSDMMIDAPKMRSMTTRGRIKLEPTEVDPRSTSGIPVSHKRTVSGHPPPGSSSAISAASSSDLTAQGIRRSTRIQAHATTSTTTKVSGSSRLANVFKSESRDKREMPKAKATGTKGRAGISTVGRVVSGNRKAPGPGERDLDSKDNSRPASVASTIRETREGGVKRSATHPNVIIEQSSHEEDALRWLLDLYGKLGEAYYNLSRYNSQKALDIFKALPASQRETPWVLAKLGRALYEKSQYQEAADVFAKVRKAGTNSGRESGAFGGSNAESAWMEDMHIYSTVLWHLKREIELAYLAHELLELDRLAPEAWVALGNSFSLQREHEKAIKCFKRATQLSDSSAVSGAAGNKGGAYAWTLMGHEHVVQEEFDKAQNCYREAISSNPRHYAGWYGLGQVYEKLGKYDIAERHYRVAWGVNPKNGVLAVCLGLVCEKLARESGGGMGHGGGFLDPKGENRIKQALEWYERAVRMDPKSAKARFMKARTLMRLAQMPNGGGQLDFEPGEYVADRDPRRFRLLHARAELEMLREMAGDESMVHFLLGRCLKLLGDRAGAIREMTIALELDPKASPHIKEALESLEIDEEGSFDENDDD